MDIETSQSVADLSHLLSVRERLRSGRVNKDEKLREACDDFEAIFLQQMFKSMRDTLPGNALIEKSMAQDVFQSMLDQEVCTQIAHNRGLGLGDMLYNDLKGKIDPNR